MCHSLVSDLNMDSFFRVNEADTERREYTAEIDQLKARYTIQLMLFSSIFCRQYGLNAFLSHYPSVWKKRTILWHLYRLSWRRWKVWVEHIIIWFEYLHECNTCELVSNFISTGWSCWSWTAIWEVRDFFCQFLQIFVVFFSFLDVSDNDRLLFLCLSVWRRTHAWSRWRRNFNSLKKRWSEWRPRAMWVHLYPTRPSIHMYSTCPHCIYIPVYLHLTTFLFISTQTVGPRLPMGSFISTQPVWPYLPYLCVHIYPTCSYIPTRPSISTYVSFYTYRPSIFTKLVDYLPYSYVYIYLSISIFNNLFIYLTHWSRCSYVSVHIYPACLTKTTQVVSIYTQPVHLCLLVHPYLPTSVHSYLSSISIHIYSLVCLNLPVCPCLPTYLSISTQPVWPYLPNPFKYTYLSIHIHTLSDLT